MSGELREKTQTVWLCAKNVAILGTFHTLSCETVALSLSLGVMAEISWLSHEASELENVLKS